MKTTKSFTKRITITRQGKIVRRRMGISHFKTRKTNKLLRKQTKTISLDHSKKALLNY